MATDVLDEGFRNLGANAADFPSLSRAFELSAELVGNGRKILAKDLPDNGDPEIDVVAFGSLARYEMTPASDLDYLVVVYGFDKEPGASRHALELADNLRKTINPGHEIREPGSTGMFGKIVSAIDLVEVIGLENDTNRSHSRRILLLEESVSLYQRSRHDHLLRSILTRYLEAKPLGETKIPRFLLNDLARYWRTLTVDYQAKTADVAAYSTRYLKLILSRKFTYASSILPLFATGLRAANGEFDPETEMLTELVGTFSKPPIVRFIDACVQLRADEIRDAGIRALNSIETFNGLLADSDWRRDIEIEASSDPRSQAKFLHGRELGRQLQDSLETIFFSEQLRPMTQRYLVF